MKRALVMIPVLAMSLTAFAGKEERDALTKEVMPSVKKAEATYKSSCGCALTITVSSTLKTKDDLYQAKHVADNITEEAPGYCNDAASKKVMCTLKSIEIVKGDDTKFVFNKGKGTSITDGQSYAPWEMITAEVDK